MEFISFRADKELKKQMEVLAKLENKNKSDEYREIFLMGLEEKKKDIALKEYQTGKISLGKAAELAGLTSWEFLQLLKERNIPMNITKDEILKGVGNL